MEKGEQNRTDAQNHPNSAGNGHTGTSQNFISIEKYFYHHYYVCNGNFSSRWLLCKGFIRISSVSSKSKEWTS